MARLLKQSEAKRLGLPGRTSLELVSGEVGSRLTFRIADIPPPRPGNAPRGPHLHQGFEECIYVLSGEGRTVAESGEIPIGPGDIVLIPAGEKHMTRHMPCSESATSKPQRSSWNCCSGLSGAASGGWP